MHHVLCPEGSLRENGKPGGKINEAGLPFHVACREVARTDEKAFVAGFPCLGQVASGSGLEIDNAREPLILALLQAQIPLRFQKYAMARLISDGGSFFIL